MVDFYGSRNWFSFREFFFFGRVNWFNAIFMMMNKDYVYGRRQQSTTSLKIFLLHNYQNWILHSSLMSTWRAAAREQSSSEYLSLEMELKKHRNRSKIRPVAHTQQPTLEGIPRTIFLFIYFLLFAAHSLPRYSRTLLTLANCDFLLPPFFPSSESFACLIRKKFVAKICPKWEKKELHIWERGGVVGEKGWTGESGMTVVRKLVHKLFLCRTQRSFLGSKYFFANDEEWERFIREYNCVCSPFLFGNFNFFLTSFQRREQEGVRIWICVTKMPAKRAWNEL